MDQHYSNRVISNVSVNLLTIGVLGLYVTLVTETLKQIWLKGAVSRNSAKLGNYKMPVKLRET